MILVAVAAYFFVSGIVASEVRDAWNLSTLMAIFWGIVWPVTVMLEHFDRRRLRRLP